MTWNQIAKGGAVVFGFGVYRYFFAGHFDGDDWQMIGVVLLLVSGKGGLELLQSRRNRNGAK